MDFYRIVERPAKNGVVEIYPDFIVKRSKDIMIRGGEFYAVWDEENGVWTTDEYDVQRIVDNDISIAAKEAASRAEGHISAKYMHSFSTGSWQKFMNFASKLPENYHQLDRELNFASDEVDKYRYSSKRLPYPLKPGTYSAYDELMGVLYDPKERDKLEWAIGAVISGDSRSIQKFIVLYGESGAGKSTFLNILEKLFTGYTSVFEAKALVGNNNNFATEAFRTNPLVAIQHDGDLSRIEDNTKLNSIVSHEEMVINEKHKSTYSTRLDAFLFMGTNKPVKITDAKSGIIRRLIDVQPSGRKLPYSRYKELMRQIDFELGGIASYCLDRYLTMGPDYYDSYIPEEMMLMTDYFYNYIETYFDVFKEADGVALTHAYRMYKEYCDDAQIAYSMNRVVFREELKNYFRNFEERATINGERVRSWYSGFKTERFKVLSEPTYSEPIFELTETESILDDILAMDPAQYASPIDTPMSSWDSVDTVLSDIDTSRVHFVRVPENHIVIDFDIKNAEGQKDALSNLEAASKWPPTYTEFSKGGSGVHLHYIYEGDLDTLDNEYAPGIEVKVFRGKSALRRRLTFCKNTPVATISSGLPIKEKKMYSEALLQSEKSLRDLIERNLRKEIHPGTKPSVAFIKKILDDAYESGLIYDVTNMRTAIMAFAANSTHWALDCLKMVNQMRLKSEKSAEDIPVKNDSGESPVFYDLEVFPNHLIVCYKRLGVEGITKLVDPTPHEVEQLMRFPLVGFNNRKYDNHILYGRAMGMSIEEIYNLSQRIISGDREAFFPAAYGISYTDIYDYASKKQSLKKWQVELGIIHKELGHPWDEPLPDELLEECVEYCCNDVISTEVVWKATESDFRARQILAAISGLSVNDKTQKHTSRILFHGDKDHKDAFEYTDLSKEFPGYKYSFGKSTYKGIDVGEGGFVYAEPGIYHNVALIDVASMHPTSAINMNIFGKYTKNYKDLLDARLAIKHGEFDAARKMLDGKLAPYLDDESAAKELSYALKIVINIVYGLTSAKFENDFNDKRNVDNIVAKRGALFMVDLLEAVKDRGYTVVHIKTDSIKIANADDDIIKFVMEFGEKYGYTFEHEATYDRMCLVNDAVYIAYMDGHWSATGAQFKHPYIFKKLFTHEPLTFNDYIETKEVKTALYLKMVESPGEPLEFIGRVSSFVPVISRVGGGELLREKDGKYYAATGTKGYLWLEAERAKMLDQPYESFIDHGYYSALESKAIEAISEYGDFDSFVNVG